MGRTPKKKKEPPKLGEGQCNLCSRYKNSKVICMPGVGPTNPELVLIGEAPSKTEDVWCRSCLQPATKRCEWQRHKVGMPFVGAAGQLIRKAVTEAGYDVSKVRLTNAARCSSGGPITPTMTELRKCAVYLLDELSKLDWSNCKGVMVLGRSALRGVFNDGRLDVSFTRFKPMELIGPERPAQALLEGSPEGLGASRRPPKRRSNTQVATPQEKEVVEAPSEPKLEKVIPLNVPIRCSYHPAAALPYRAPYLYDEIVGDLKTAFLPREPVKPVKHIRTAQELEELYSQTDYISLDLEWFAKGAVRMVGISDGKVNSVLDSPEGLLEWLKRKRQKSPLPGGDLNAPLSIPRQESLNQLVSKQKQWKKRSKLLPKQPNL